MDFCYTNIGKQLERRVLRNRKPPLSQIKILTDCILTRVSAFVVGQYKIGKKEKPVVVFQIGD